ncbi:hypothetical protein D3C85_1811350 [compost metagenome]
MREGGCRHGAITPGSLTCRSELARDELEGDAFIQTTRVIVNVHREQARSYRGIRFSVVIIAL